MAAKKEAKTITMFPKPKIDKGKNGQVEGLDKNVNRSSIVTHQENGKFAPGNKAGGRKQIPEDIKEMLRAAVPDAVKLLINTVKDEKVRHDLRLKAADSLLDRVYGKATQPIDGNITGVSIPQAVADLSIDELKKLIESAKK